MTLTVKLLKLSVTCMQSHVFYGKLYGAAKTQDWHGMAHIYFFSTTDSTKLSKGEVPVETATTTSTMAASEKEDPTTMVNANPLPPPEVSLPHRKENAEGDYPQQQQQLLQRLRVF